MNACELSASITALANILAGSMSREELDLLGAILTQLGDTLTTIAAYNSLCGQQNAPAPEIPRAGAFLWKCLRE